MITNKLRLSSDNFLKILDGEMDSFELQRFFMESLVWNVNIFLYKKFRKIPQKA